VYYNHKNAILNLVAYAGTAEKSQLSLRNPDLSHWRKPKIGYT